MNVSTATTFMVCEPRIVEELRTIADILGNGMKKSDDQLRDISHIIWLLLHEFEQIQIEESKIK